MHELLTPQIDDQIEPQDDLEPVVLGKISEITGSAASGGGDRDNIVWGEE